MTKKRVKFLELKNGQIKLKIIMNQTLSHTKKIFQTYI